VSVKVEDVIIIGAGPAGLATAIQLRRYGFEPLIFERAEVGGLLRNANLVENYPGFPGGIPGPRLVKLFSMQAHRAGVVVTLEEVIAVDYDQGLFQVKTGRERYCSRMVVIATGTRPLRIGELSIPVELQDRVFYEVYELARVVEKRIMIIGGGDAAFDYALNLGKKNQVTIFNRADTPKCLPLLWDRVQMVETIYYRNNTLVKKVTKDLKSGMMIDCQSPEGELQFQADYLLIAVGREANLECMTEKLLQQASRLVEQGVLHIIGDVKNGIFRQTSIAVGEGVLTAMKIYRYLKEIT
jgi:thioredoxin reductase (NADPH)